MRALSPLGAIYGAVTAHRMSKPGVEAGAPVLCVGNFVVGGAGKTPTAIAVAKMLRAKGERPAFLSRGYGGEACAEPIRVLAGSATAQRVGDEPLLLARVAPCYVGRDRVASARRAVEDGASVLVMDDGLQNPSLRRNLALAVIDGENPFGNGLCLPAGPLRAPVAAQSRFVDAALVVGGAETAVVEIGAKLPGKQLFKARLQADAIAAAALIGRPTLAFAGIARPEKFFSTLTAIGAQVVETAVFPDHWRFRPRELVRLANHAARRGLTLVTTEKDAVRLPADFAQETRVLPVSLVLDSPAAFLAFLQRL